MQLQQYTTKTWQHHSHRKCRHRHRFATVHMLMVLLAFPFPPCSTSTFYHHTGSGSTGTAPPSLDLLPKGHPVYTRDRHATSVHSVLLSSFSTPSSGFSPFAIAQPLDHTILRQRRAAAGLDPYSVDNDDDDHDDDDDNDNGDDDDNDDDDDGDATEYDISPMGRMSKLVAHNKPANGQGPPRETNKPNSTSPTAKSGGNRGLGTTSVGQTTGTTDRGSSTFSTPGGSLPKGDTKLEAATASLGTGEVESKKAQKTFSTMSMAFITTGTIAAVGFVAIVTAWIRRRQKRQRQQRDEQIDAGKLNWDDEEYGTYNSGQRRQEFKLDTNVTQVTAVGGGGFTPVSATAVEVASPGGATRPVAVVGGGLRRPSAPIAQQEQFWNPSL